MSRKQIHDKAKWKYFVSDVVKGHITILNVGLERKSADNVIGKNTENVSSKTNWEEEKNICKKKHKGKIN